MNDNELDEILSEIKARNTEGAEEASSSVEETVGDLSKEAEAVGEAAQEAVEETAQPAEEAVEDAVEETTQLTEKAVEETAQLTDEAAEEAAQLAEEAAEETAQVADEGAMDILAVSEELSYDGTVDLMTAGEEPPVKKSKKGVVIAIISLLIVAALAAGAYAYFSGMLNPKNEVEQQAITTTEPEPSVEFDKSTANPLTGEYGFNKTALSFRPVAVVVENEYSTEAVRPQWGMKEADIVMEGESEFSTRLLFFYADMMSMPDQIGPSRSARPPFIRFSQMWDAVFIHTGLSRSKGNYIGADQVFESENIDHINLLAQTEDGTYFGRNNERQTAVEHTGYLNGKNVYKLIENNKIRIDVKESNITRFEFNDENEALSEKEAEKVSFKWSDRCPKTGVFTYDEEKQKYVTEDFDSKYGTADLEYETLIFLLDDTEYVIKENYKGSGKSETYCEYEFSGGEAKVLSEGTVVDAEWEKKDGKLSLTTKDGEAIKLNRGKIYIGFGSANHGGSITVE